MTKMPLVTVVMTTYNRADDAFVMARRLLDQDYPELEIIVVNDGSTDDTENRLAGIVNPRLKLITKPNGGPSSARNSGLEAATGEFIMFVDDDDEVPLDYISSFMVPELKEYDLVIDSYSNRVDDHTPTFVSFPTVAFKSGRDTIDYLCGTMPDRPYCFFSVGKRFKTSIIKQNNLRFSTSIRFGEDRPFVLEYLLFAHSCRIVDMHKYIVRAQSQSAYRLSKGVKSIAYLWQNIADSYSLLKDIERHTGLSSVGRYADNYFATRTLDYILTPYCQGVYPSKRDKEIVRESLSFLRSNVRVKNVGRADARLISMLNKILGHACLALWKVRVQAGMLYRRML